MRVPAEEPSARVAAIAALLHDIWGDSLAAGPAPWDQIAAEIIEIDDRLGKVDGFVVQSDGLPLEVLAELVAYLPERLLFQGLLPPALRTRVRRARSTVDVTADRDDVGNSELAGREDPPGPTSG